VLLLFNERFLVTQATPTTISLLHMMSLLAQTETPGTVAFCNEQTFTTVGLALDYGNSLWFETVVIYCAQISWFYDFIYSFEVSV